MNQPRTSRSRIPSAASLGLSRPHAAADLAALGWDTEERLDLLWTLAATGDPDQALNNIVRLMQATDDPEGLQDRLDTDHVFRVRLLGLFGASTLLGDHVVANPEIWPLLGEELPGGRAMLTTMLDSVGAEEVEGTDEDGDALHAADSLLRRATVTGADADRAMRTAYRTILA
ncbi:MAG: bifunctional glutamine-synthetase adenylyltransferase/deadenyltransferase, partial [Corynebacterium variabile]